MKDKEEIIAILNEKNIPVLHEEEFLGGTGDIVADNRNYVAKYHIENMDGYFQRAESMDNLSIFWARESVFYQMFTRLDLTNVIELACGRGRHVQQYVDAAKSITLVDILEENIIFCKERFKGNTKINYYKNNGYDLLELKSDTYTSLFTYDAMVHFELLDVFNYLKETHRVLTRGGRALFHHSNNTEDYRISFATGSSGRNYMSKELFAHLANRAGLKIIEQHLIDWTGIKGLDCVTLVEK